MPREYHVDEQLGLIIVAIFTLAFITIMFSTGWVARGLYEDHVARQIVKRLCAEGVMCAELSD